VHLECCVIYLSCEVLHDTGMAGPKGRSADSAPPAQRRPHGDQDLLIISQAQTEHLRKIESRISTPDLGAGAGTDEEPEPDTHRGSEVVCGVAQVPCRVSLSPRTCIRNKTGR
jgi:hypothetical protein